MYEDLGKELQELRLENKILRRRVVELERKLNQDRPAPRKVAPGEDRRQEPRIDILLKVSGLDGKEAIPAYVVNLNESGMLLEGYESIPDGSSLSVKFLNLQPDQLTEIHGHVVWVHHNAGDTPSTYQCGLIFEDLTPETRKALRILLEKVRFAEDNLSYQN
ncbi:MAG: PilZ domain-containing protein [Thermodesulfobacteriota bacterium]